MFVVMDERLTRLTRFKRSWVQYQIPIFNEKMGSVLVHLERNGAPSALGGSPSCIVTVLQRRNFGVLKRNKHLIR